MYNFCVLKINFSDTFLLQAYLYYCLYSFISTRQKEKIKWGIIKIVWKTVLYILQRKKLISKISFSTLEIVWTRLTLHTKILTDKKAHSFMQRIFSMWFSYTRHCAVWYEWSRKYSMSKIKNIKENFKKKLFLESFRIHRMHSPQRKLGNN